ncbi:PREDICTED: protein abrupt-like [Papilio polytes]|uniref:protein abrupt-like n=1 Tax=Papilio polytes TaxID=76194 RepID=UPI0006766DBF|nr:PREDICTED: protein abrupt-like [Papilio polytes]
MTTKFSLRWTDFHTNLNQSLEDFLNAEELVDVTLTAGGKEFRAHKLILSICSPFFKDLFIKNPCEHPTIVLNEVEHVELSKLLQFIYHGEVIVTQQELNPFLETAEFLQIKGLASIREKYETAVAESESNVKQETTEPKPTIDCHADGDSKTQGKTEAIESTDSVNESIQKDSVLSSLKRSFESTQNSDSCSKEKISRQDSDISIPTENNEERKVVEPTDETVCSIKPETVKDSRPRSKGKRKKKLKCTHCYRHFANNNNLKVHMQDKHDNSEGNLECDKCHKNMKNQSCLRVHLYNHHKLA